MPIILIMQQSPLDLVDPKLKKAYERLSKGLKDEWNINILDGKSSFILDLFEYKFRPMFNDFVEHKLGLKDVAIALQEYGERAEAFRSLYNYAQDRYEIDLCDEPYCNALKYNTELATAEITKMLQHGLSLEHCYRYMLKESTRLHPTPMGKPN